MKITEVELLKEISKNPEPMIVYFVLMNLITCVQRRYQESIRYAPHCGAYGEKHE